MNKTELVEAIAKKAGLSKKDSAAAVDAFVETVTTALKKKDKVQLVGFGTFEVRDRKEREGRKEGTSWDGESASREVKGFCSEKHRGLREVEGLAGKHSLEAVSAFCDIDWCEYRRGSVCAVQG